MKISLTKQEAQLLIDKKLLKPLGDNLYQLSIRSPVSELFINLDVVIDITKEEKRIIQYKTQSKDFIDMKFEELKIAFPRDDSNGEFPKTRVLITGQGDSKDRFRRLIKEEGFEADDIIKAAKYEAQWRIRAGILAKQNKLSFMQAMPSWLNNPDNIKVQIEDMIDDVGVNLEGTTQDIIDDAIGRTTRVF